MKKKLTPAEKANWDKWWAEQEKKQEYEDRTDPHKNRDRWGDLCHCHNDCEACGKYPDRPNTICIHCKPEHYREDELTPIRKDLDEILKEAMWDMCGEECGWNHYGHKGYYCRCGEEEAREETIRDILAIFKKHKQLLTSSL